MIDLAEEVVVQVVVKEVCMHPRALRHPVQPQAAAAPRDAVVADDGVNGGMELDACHFRSREEAAHVNVVDGVTRDLAEGRAHAAHNAGLLAVVHGIVAHHMVADPLLRPPLLQRLLNRLYIALGGVGRGVVPLIADLAQRDARADRVADLIVFNDPALAPVRPDQANLPCCGWRPGRGRLTQNEAPHRDVVHAHRLRKEDALADMDLNHFAVGVDPGKLRPERCGGLAHLAEPERIALRGLLQFLPLRGLHQPVPVQVDRAGVVSASLGVEPVAVDHVAEGIEAAEEAVRQGQLP